MSKSSGAVKVWITKYALTSGIIEAEGEIFNTNYLDVKGYTFLSKSDYETNEGAAKNRAEQMRQAKIASLKKQIAKLEKLEF